MKPLLYIALGLVLIAAVSLLIAPHQVPENNPVIVLGLIALCAIPSVGAFWMMYMSIRHERNPFLMVALAMFVPFMFVWYYFDRVRPGKLGRTPHETTSETN